MSIRIFFLAVLLFAAHVSASPSIVRYIGSNPGVDEGYYLAMLEAALKATAKGASDYEIIFTEETLSSQRKRELMLTGERINVDRFIEGPIKTAEYSNLIKVNYRLLNGFLGYRVPLIRKGTQERFDHVKNIDDLRKIKMGLGAGWEGWLYERNGFSVAEPIGMMMLLKMLKAGRFDFVPLGATEIQSEYKIESGETLDLVPEKNLLIRYDFAPYFFVSNKHPLLAKRLETGLKLIDKNGTSKKIFDSFFADHLKNLNIANRRIIEIKNAEIPEFFVATDRK